MLNISTGKTLKAPFAAQWSQNDHLNQNHLFRLVVVSYSGWPLTAKRYLDSQESLHRHFSLKFSRWRKTNTTDKQSPLNKLFCVKLVTSRSPEPVKKISISERILNELKQMLTNCSSLLMAENSWQFFDNNALYLNTIFDLVSFALQIDIYLVM